MTKIILKSVKPHQINKISRLIRLKELIPKKNLSQNVKHLKNFFYKFASVNKVILLVILYSQLISLTTIDNYNKKGESI